MNLDSFKWKSQRDLNYSVHSKYYWYYYFFEGCTIGIIEFNVFLKFLDDVEDDFEMREWTLRMYSTNLNLVFVKFFFLLKKRHSFIEIDRLHR